MESGVFYLYMEYRNNKQRYEFMTLDIDEYNRDGKSYSHWRWRPCCWDFEDGIVLLKRKKQSYIELELSEGLLYKQQTLVGIEPFVKHTPEQLEIERALRKKAKKGMRIKIDQVEDDNIDEEDVIQYQEKPVRKVKDVKDIKSKKGVKPKQIKPNKAVEEKEVVVKKKDWWDEKIF